MTNLDALKAEIEPFTLSSTSLEKALTDSKLVSSATYSDEKALAYATVKALSKLTVLSKETEGKFSQDFASGKVEKRIIGICKKHGFDVSEFVNSSSISNGSNLW